MVVAAKFRWSIEKSWVHQIQGRGTPVLRRVWTMRKSQSGHLRENKSRIRAKEGEEHRRAAFLQDTRLTVVESFGICSQVRLSGGWVKILKWNRSGTSLFLGKCWHFLRPENALARSGGLSDTRPDGFLNTRRIRSVDVFLHEQHPENARMSGRHGIQYVA